MSCRVVGHALLEARYSEIDGMRNRPAPAGAPPLPPRFLRHADEHTIVGLHAVLDVIAANGLSPSTLVGHAVIGAPCQMGRLATARVLVAMPAAGAMAIKPHVVPQCSLHSLAGAVSVAIGMHGPHLGIGGGVGAIWEGLLAATTLLMSGGDPDCRSTWLVATEWDEEPALDDTATPTDNPLCRGLAVLLEATSSDDGDGEHEPAVTLCVQPAHRATHIPLHTVGSSAIVALSQAIQAALEAGGPATWTLEGPWGVDVRIERPASTHSVREAA
jgi:hypothetical protein